MITFLYNSLNNTYCDEDSSTITYFKNRNINVPSNLFSPISKFNFTTAPNKKSDDL